MKVGFSLSRCMLDIYEGRVDINDVLVIVARTNCDQSDDSWSELWHGYRSRHGLSRPEWITVPDEGENTLREIYNELFNSGKLHQPRQFGAHPQRMPYYWLETFAPEDVVADNPATLKAWEKYKVLAGLS